MLFLFLTRDSLVKYSRVFRNLQKTYKTLTMLVCNNNNNNSNVTVYLTVHVRVSHSVCQVPYGISVNYCILIGHRCVNVVKINMSIKRC